jgi:hypothetical protein
MRLIAYYMSRLPWKGRGFVGYFDGFDFDALPGLFSSGAGEQQAELQHDRADFLTGAS